jgi:hypothetical protein
MTNSGPDTKNIGATITGKVSLLKKSKPEIIRVTLRKFKKYYNLK